MQCHVDIDMQLLFKLYCDVIKTLKTLIAEKHIADIVLTAKFHENR